MNDDFRIFMNNELQLLDSCSIIPDNSFDDYQAQAKHSATYILWLIKQIPDSRRIEFQDKLKTENLKALLNKACPERENAVESLFSLSNLANCAGPPVHPHHQRSSALLKRLAIIDPASGDRPLYSEDKSIVVVRISSIVGGRMGSIDGFSTSLEALGSFSGFEAITVKLEWAAQSATTHK
ncbi:hypothetical protein ACFX19_010735 [Malus domestica]